MLRPNAPERVALVHAAATPLGLATLDRLLDEGFLVYAATPDPERIATQIARGARSLRVDPLSDESVRLAVERVIDEQGRVDVLVAPTACAWAGAFESIDLSMVSLQFNQHLIGLARIVQAVLRFMRIQGSGRLVVITSAAGALPTALMGWTACAKHGIEALASSVRSEVARFGIQVTVVQAGRVRTGFDLGALKTLDAVEHPPAYSKEIAELRDRIERTYSDAPDGNAVLTAVVDAADAEVPPGVQTVGDARVDLFLRGTLGDEVHADS